MCDRAAFFALDKVHGYRRDFSLEDTSYVSSHSLLFQPHSRYCCRLRHPYVPFPVPGKQTLPGLNEQVRRKGTRTRKYPPLSAPRPFLPVTMKGPCALHDMLRRASRHPTTHQSADYSLLVGSAKRYTHSLFRLPLLSPLTRASS